MALVKHENHQKDLGEVLVKVKQDLIKLREKLEVSASKAKLPTVKPRSNGFQGDFEHPLEADFYHCQMGN